MKESYLPVFVVNLKKRFDRKENILKEFEGKSEFALTFVEPLKNKNPALSLWMTIKYIVKNHVSDADDLIIICEDDHQFTDNYSKNTFLEYIIEAQKLNADILSGGVSCVRSSFQINSSLFWMEEFTGFQFTVIFRRLFQSIIDYKFSVGMDADIVISDMANNKLLLYPFISTQKEFGYSDVTVKNNTQGIVQNYFVATAEAVDSLNKVDAFYKCLKNVDESDGFEANYNISTYLISQIGREEYLENVKGQFFNRSEFDVSVIEQVEDENFDFSLWLTIQKIVKRAVENDDDVIVICEDQHEFTAQYSKEQFFKNILHAYHQGVGVLLGGVGKFGSAVYVNEDRFWINNFSNKQFVILYRSMFQVILDEIYQPGNECDKILSEVTSNKMVIYPFIAKRASKQLSVNTITDDIKCSVKSFEESFDRLSKIRSYVKNLTDNNNSKIVNGK
ncbi:MAG: hypothetical protein JWP94_535 [Mucilaginibacter sp.]|nr:hypothetical protein [Mucilaginibacter sp.]